MRSLVVLCMLMALTITSSATPVEIGKPAPDFQILDLDAKPVKRSDFKGKIVVLEWINEGCPFSRGHYLSGNMQALQKEYTGKGVVWLTINSTNTVHPEYHSPSAEKTLMAEWKSFATDHLVDPSGTVGRLYGAKTTPHMFVIDAGGNLRYTGAIDDHRGTDGGKSANVNYVRAALDALLAGKDVTVTTTTPYGCSVKYQ